jgi:TRAP-type C4-dicarboxylate transport system permease small subunit
LENGKPDVASGRRIPEETLGAWLLAALLAITLANVFVRYFTDQSFAWTEEISSFLMLVLAMAGSAAAIVRDTHIRVEYFFQSRDPSRHKAFARFSALANALFFLLMGALSAQMAWDEFRFGDTSPAIGIPKWWYSIWLPIFCGIICARSVQRLRAANITGQASHRPGV